MDPMTPDFLDALISAAGMTAFAEDCDRPVLARRNESNRPKKLETPGTDDQPRALDILDRHDLGL